MEFNNEFDTIIGKRISLNITDKNQGSQDELPFYYYDIYLLNTTTQVGKISIRIGHNYHSYFNGNVGYEINEEFRGNHYALESVKLIIDVAKYHHMKHLILSCAEDNVASYKTIEKLDAQLIEVVIPPKEYIFYYEGIEPHRIYRMDIRSFKDLFSELHHKLEWCVLTLQELKEYQLLNSRIISNYMMEKWNLMFSDTSSIISDELLPGRQKGFLIESVIGFLVVSICELYRINKIKDSTDSVLYTKLIKLYKNEIKEDTSKMKIISDSYKRFKETISVNSELLSRLEIARNKIYSHHTNYNPKVIQTDYVRKTTGISATIKNETNISQEEIIKLLNPYIEFINIFITLSDELTNDYKTINLII